MMQEYHKIQSIYQRDNRGKFLIGEWSEPELGYLKDIEWTWDEKIDGTNTRIDWDKSEVRFGGRTEQAEIPIHLLNVLKDMFKPEKFKKHYRTASLTLYGEGYGPKIQKIGAKYRDDNSFCLFDVWCGGYWLKRDSVIDIADKLGLDVAPIVGSGTISEAIEFVTKGFYSSWGKFAAEGLVLRPQVQLFNRMGKRIITKVKSKDFK